MNKIVILVILFIGIVFRLSLTSNGNFIFNLDNGRDMVEVREMVELRKPRLTGPNTPIQGVYDGPGWYYLLAVPYIITSGDPYGSIVMQIVLWAIGGFYLLKLTSRWGILAMLGSGFLWVASNYIVLASVYAFNPNPVLFLTPLFIYLIEKYLLTQRLIYGVLMWFLAGLFFNFEMNFGAFTPLIIFFSILFSKKIHFLRTLNFWIGTVFFLLWLLPQFIFDIRHQFIMTKGFISFLQSGSGKFNLPNRINEITQSFYQVLIPTILNLEIPVKLLIILLLATVISFIKKDRKDILIIISLVVILVPFISYLFLPVAVNPWHLGAEMIAILMLISYLLKNLTNYTFWTKLTSITLTAIIIFFACKNVINFFVNDRGKPSQDPSVLKNEIAVIDYIYKYANGKNFKVYTYLPSIYDYPYQYLIWWYGLKKYRYLPIDYAYAPDKPQYVPSKAKFSATEKHLSLRGNSNLVFLIKEPDRNHTRSGWEGDFIKYNWQTLEKTIIGPIEVEIKRE